MERPAAVLALTLLLTACGSVPETAPVVTASGATFIQAGVVVKDTPGLPPGTWNFVYAENGKTGMHKELRFDQNSVCASNTGDAVCTTSTLQNGQRFHLQAKPSGTGTLQVLRMTAR